MHVSREFVRKLEGYGLTTAKIFYRRPDYRSVLQEFVWQHEDICPEFPELRKFLEFWRDNLDGPLHSVEICHSRLLKPAELKTINGQFWLH